MLITTTPRLSIRWLEARDASFFRELVNSPGWVRYIGKRDIPDDSAALAYLEKGIFKNYREDGYGFYMVELSEGKFPIGICGLVNRGTLPGPDFGFAFLPGYHGKGYAQESAAAILPYIENTLRIDELYAIVLPENEASIKLLGKLGFKSSGTVTLDKEELILFVRKANKQT